jgi:uncharacterized membrane protein
MDSADTNRTDGDIRRYLAELDLALAGADAALRHDAIIDAEAHLRAATKGGATAARAIAEFGTPAEIARAYCESGAATQTRSEDIAAAIDVQAAPDAAAPATPRTGFAAIPVVGIWAQPAAWGALLYFGAVGFVLATVYFTWTVAVGGTALGLMPVLVGIPLLVLLLGSARALCLFEGKVVEALLRVRMPRRVQPVEGADSVGFWTRIGCWLRDVRSWLSLAYLLGNFPVSVAMFAVTVSLAAAGALLVATPVLWALGVPVAHVEGVEGEVQFLWNRVTPDANGDVWVPAGMVVPSLLAGLALFTATLWLARGMGWVYGHVVQAIQVARPQPVPRIYR